MPKIIKEAKNVEILVNIKYEETEEELIQKFQFIVSNKKYLDYIYDKRYLFKNKIDNLINSLLLNGFKSRTDCKDEIIMKYEKQEHPKNVIRKIICIVPPYCGCNYCDKAKKEGLFIFCKEKKKHYTEGIKRCPIFHMKEEILT